MRRYLRVAVAGQVDHEIAVFQFKEIDVLGAAWCFAMTIIDEEEAKQTQEALIAMSQLEHEVGDFLGLNQK